MSNQRVLTDSPVAECTYMYSTVLKGATHFARLGGVKAGSSYKVDFIFGMVHMSDRCCDNIHNVKRPGDSVTQSFVAQ